MKARADWRERLSRDNLGRIALGLGIGAAGGALGTVIGLPLAWMIGAMFACIAASVSGLPVDVPLWMRTRFLIVLGLFLGESFGGAGPGEMLRWPISVGLALLYVPVSMWAAYHYYRRIAGEAPLTAAFSAVPGGLTAVVTVAGAIGADERRVALTQALRVALVVVGAPALAFGVFGMTEVEVLPGSGPEIMGLGSGAILLMGGIASAWALERIGVPVAVLMGPMLASWLLRASGLVDGSLPIWLVDIALLVTGASIGARFGGIGWGTLLRLSIVTLGGTAVMMALSAAFAGLVSLTLGVDYLVALLAFAPGGIAEMALIALAMDADPAFVAVHHAARIMLIMAIVPMMGAAVRRRRKARR